MRKLLLLASLVIGSLTVHAQSMGTGAYAFATFDTPGFDSINAGNFNVRFSIPIVNRPGRGLPFSYALQYEGLIWSPVTLNGSTAWVNDPGWGFTGTLNGSAFAGYISNTQRTGPCPTGTSGGFMSVWSAYVYHDPYGADHPLNYGMMYTGGCPPHPDGLTRTGDGSTSDGSGYAFDGTNILTKDGRVIHPGASATGQDASSVTDSNGNQISKSSGGSFTDSLGVNALSITGSGPISFTYPVTLQANSATTASTVLTYRVYTVRTNFQCSGVSEYGSNSVNLVDKITLADGSFYQFGYEATPGATDGAVTARLSSITLPTGGVIGYSYSGGCGGSGINADGTVANLTRTTTDGIRTYMRSQLNGNPGTTIQDEKGNQTVFAFTQAGSSPILPYETHRQVHVGSTGTVLKDQYTCYNGAVANCDGQAVSTPISEVDTVTSYDGGSQSLSKNAYDPSGTLLTSSSQYQGSTLLQQTTLTYNSLGEVLSSNTTDGSNNFVSSSTFGYDETSPTATSGITQHTSVSSQRGNQTSTHVNTGNGWLNTTTAFYDTGMPFSTTAQDGGQSSFTYDATQGFVTQTTLPTPSSGVPLNTSASFDATSAAMLSSTGMNAGETTTVNQYDALGRPLSVTLPSGSQMTYSYTFNSPNQDLVTQSLGGGANAYTAHLVDGYGRPSRVAVASSSTWYVTDYCYDVSGLLLFQSMPYAQPNGFNSSKVCTGAGTSYVYDALGRPTSVSNADGTTTYRYTSRAELTTDVNGVQKITQYDLLGRISGVCEISSAPLGSDSPSSCNMDIGGTGYLTSYSYDLANHKTTVSQGVQQRIFQTDAAGRTTFTSEPERGTTSYAYSYNSTGLLVRRTRPKANQQNSAVLTNTSTQYDLLGRVVGTTYDDGLTLPKTYLYDTTSADWNVSTQHSAGRLTAVTNGSSTATVFAYDVGGNPAQIRQCLPGYCGQHQRDVIYNYVYNPSGTVQSESYLTQAYAGSTATNAYTYSPASELLTITHTQNPPGSGTSQTQTVFSASGLTPNGPTSYQTGNGAATSVSYDALGRQAGNVSCLGGTPGSGLSCQSGQMIYGYSASAKGPQMQQTNDTVLGPNGITYDGFNRLQSINYSSLVVRMNWTYDRYGNRLTQTLGSGSTYAEPQPQFAYDSATNHNLSDGTYDAAGNDTRYGTWVYDAEGAVVQYGDGSQNVYDPLGHLVQQSNSGNGYTRLFAYGINNRREATLDGSETVLTNEISAGGQLFAYYHAADGSLTYRYQNQVGTEAAREHGGVITTYTSLPFADAPGTHLAGSPNQTSGEDDDPAHFAGTDVTVTSTPWQQDTFHHAQFREYSSNKGQWLSPDPYSGSYDVTNPQSLNRYAYVLNNPLVYMDPDGEDWSGGGLCYLTASNCGAGGGGGGVGGGGNGLATLQASANSFVWFSQTSQVYVVPTEGGTPYWSTTTTYTSTYIGVSLFGSGYTSNQSTNNGSAPSSGPLTPKGNACKSKVTSAVNKALNVNATYEGTTAGLNDSTYGPGWRNGAYNFNFFAAGYGGTTSPGNCGRFKPGVTGTGGSLHVIVPGGGCNPGGDPYITPTGIVTINGQTGFQFTAHIDSAYAYSFWGAIQHFIQDVLLRYPHGC